MTEPLVRAKKVLANCSYYDGGKKCVAAIDFGTTCCTVEYKTSWSKDIQCYRFERIYTRVPNAVMIGIQNDGKITVESYGLAAQREYNHRGTGTHPAGDMIYFERIKMMLERDQCITRESVVQDVTGQKLYLVEVIAVILKYLKQQLIKHLANEPFPPSSEDFTWVITIPAIWKAKAKRMMREAAYMASLLQNSEGITKFTPVGQPIARPSEENAENLYLALEPDVAAIYAQEYTKSAYETQSLKCPETYLLCDVGGGTIDVTVHSQHGTGIEIISTPLGSGCAGTTVNKAFSKTLQHVLDDEDFETFRAAERKADRKISELVYTEFEGEKVKFGKNENKRQYSVNISNEMTKYYTAKKFEDGVKKVDGMSFDASEDFLTIEPHLMKLFFEKSGEAITVCLEKALANCDGRHIELVYLVGGFGSSSYVKDLVDNKLKLAGINIDIIVPETAELSVAKGAVMWGLNPNIVMSRKVDATYGIVVQPPFGSSGKYDPYYKIFDEEERIYRCDSVFCVFFKKGEEARRHECYTTKVIPYSSNATEVEIGFYTTSKTGVQYKKDKNGFNNLENIGSIRLNIPNPENLPRNERTIDVTMDFSGTEIKATAKYRLTGEEVKTVCDFLTPIAVAD